MRWKGDGVELGQPVGTWRGPGELTWRVERSHFVAMGPDWPSAVEPVVAELLRRRRRTFCYCGYCRRLTPPEGRLNGQMCYGCGSAWWGIVY